MFTKYTFEEYSRMHIFSFPIAGKKAFVVSHLWLHILKLRQVQGLMSPQRQKNLLIEKKNQSLVVFVRKCRKKAFLHNSESHALRPAILCQILRQVRQWFWHHRKCNSNKTKGGCEIDCSRDKIVGFAVELLLSIYVQYIRA